MMGFWGVSVLLIAIAVAAVLWPLLKREEVLEETPGERRESAPNENVTHFRNQLSELDIQINSGVITEEDGLRLKKELEKKLVDELEQAESFAVHSNRKTPGISLVLAVLIPVMAIPLYMNLGAQTELKVQKAIFQGSSPESLQEVLEGWVEKRPDNDKALFMLGSHYMETDQPDEAIKVYRRLFRISNGHPQVAAELAQSLFLKADNEITKEVRKLYERSLRGDENNTTALGLKGIDAFSSEDYKGAIEAWQQALRNEPNPGARQSLTMGIGRARSMLGEEVAKVRVMIDVTPDLQSLPDSTRVIVFARPAGTKQPPILALPLTVGELPREVVLDDSASMMMGGEPLSSYDVLDIVARISLSGDVMSADYQVEAKGIKITESEPVRLVFGPAG